MGGWSETKERARLRPCGVDGSLNWHFPPVGLARSRLFVTHTGQFALEELALLRCSLVVVAGASVGISFL